MSFFNATKCGCYSSLHFLEDNPWIYVQGDSAFCWATTVTDCSPLALLFKSLWERSYIDTLKKNLFWCCLSVKMSPDTTAKMLGHRKTICFSVCMYPMYPNMYHRCRLSLHQDNLPPSILLVQMSLSFISGHIMPINYISKFVGLIILGNLCS